MPGNSIFDHDNSAYNAQVKRPLHYVMEHYNIPRPIKLTHGNNLKTVQDILSGDRKNIDNNKILQLVYSARDNAALTPAAYYLITDKAKNFSNEQIKNIVSILSADATFFMLQNYLTIFLCSAMIGTSSD